MRFVSLKRLRKKIENLEFNIEGETFNATISLGVCDLNDSIKDSATWISQADKALYRAKLNGRNRSVIYRDTAEKHLH